MKRDLRTLLKSIGKAVCNLLNPQKKTYRSTSKEGRVSRCRRHTTRLKRPHAKLRGRNAQRTGANKRLKLSLNRGSPYPVQGTTKIERKNGGKGTMENIRFVLRKERSQGGVGGESLRKGSFFFKTSAATAPLT